MIEVGDRPGHRPDDIRGVFEVGIVAILALRGLFAVDAKLLQSHPGRGSAACHPSLVPFDVRHDLRVY